MSGILILLDETQRDFGWQDLLDSMTLAGIEYTQLDAMPQIVLVPELSVADFPFDDHPAILSVEPDQPKTAKPVDQVTVASFPDYGPWPRLRHTNRKTPWPKLGLRLPWVGEFDCVRTGLGVDIYLVDTGLLPTHQEFGGRAEKLDTFVPLHGHGTQCAACAAGATVGLAVESHVFVAAGLRNADNTGSSADIITGLNACLAKHNERAPLNRPSVVSLSFLMTNGGTIFDAAVGTLIDAGMVVCAAAGNDRLNTEVSVLSPAEAPGVITVGGLNMADGPYDQGNYGTNYGIGIDILAGSQNIRTASFAADNAYHTGSGTSYGTPYVAGTIACMLQGYLRPTTRQHVLNVHEALLAEATYGEFVPSKAFDPIMPNSPAILYLNPGPGPYRVIPDLMVGTPTEPSPTVGWRYWRLLAESDWGGGGIDFYEVQFRTDGVDQTSPALAAARASASSSFDATLTPAKAFDDLTNTRWASVFTNTYPQWLQWDFGEGADKKINSVTYTVYVTTGRSPKGLKIQCSTNGVQWTTAYENANQPATLSGEVTFTTPALPGGNTGGTSNGNNGPTSAVVATSVKDETSDRTTSIASTGVQEGELLLLHLSCGTAAGVHANAVLPDGFTLLDAFTLDRGAGLVAAKIATANEPAQYTVTWPAGGITRSILELVRIGNHAGLSGVAVTRANTSSNSNNAPAPATAAVPADTLHAIFFSGGWGGGSSTYTLAGYTTLAQGSVAGDGGNGASSGALYQRVASAGVIPAKTVAHTNSAHGGIYFIGWSVTVKPYGA